VESARRVAIWWADAGLLMAHAAMAAAMRMDVFTIGVGAGGWSWFGS
jgi:hypothetical protein